MSEPTTTLIEALRQPARYPHPVSDVRLVQTHISWVLLTGEFAYKIKKPLRLEFLDFSTLEARLHFCREELRLNRRLVPQLYLDVVPIGGAPSNPVLGATPAFEYAVKMRQFDPALQLDRLVENDTVDLEALATLGRTVARFHAAADSHPPEPYYGTASHTRQVWLESFQELAHADVAQQPVAGLREWLEQRHSALAGTLEQRREEGWIREGHGDLHLSNIVSLGAGLVPFDCLEFDPALRWVDTMDDTSFLLMDLDARGRPGLGAIVLSTYLEAGGDYAGAGLLDYYLVQRSLVRAKVAAIRLRQAPEDEDARGRLEHHIELADWYTQARQPLLVLTQGVSGSGKSVLARALVRPLAAVQLRSDVERKRLAGLAPESSSDSQLGSGLYSADMTRRTYDRLAEITAQLLAAGRSVIVDATMLDTAQRDRFLRLAEGIDARAVVARCEAPEEVLRARVASRAAKGSDASEADLGVLEHQLMLCRKMSPPAIARSLTVRSDEPYDAVSVAQALREAARGDGG